MYDVVLVYLNIVNGKFTGAEYQLDCGYIGSYLIKSGKSVCQYINKNLSSIQSLITDLKSNYKCNIYCFYINEYNYFVSKTVINNLKKVFGNCNVIIAGPSAEYIGNYLLNEVEADYCITHDTAITLDCILDQKKKESISNIFYREGKEIYTTKKEFFDYTLDSLGFPYQSGMIPPEEVQNVGMLTSVGCYGNCTFCSYKKDNKAFKVHTVEAIMEEIAYISHYIKGKNVRLNFVDDCFSMNSERTYAVCMNLKRRNYLFRYWCCSRADLLNEDIIDLMAECNFSGVVIGLETASEKIFGKIGKIENSKNSLKYINRIADIFKYGKKKGINPYVSANFGLPFEEYDDVQKTLQYLVKNNMRDNVSICFTTAFPGSQLFDKNYLFDSKIETTPYKLPFRSQYKDYMKSVYYQLEEIGYQKHNVQMWKRIIAEAFSGVCLSDLKKNKNCVKYIFVNKLNKATLNIISRYISVNGYILVEMDKLEFKNVLYSEDRKTLCMTTKQYDSIMHEAYAEDCYIPNIIFYHISNGNIYFQPNANYIPKKSAIKLREIKSIHDYEELYAEALRYATTQVILISNLKKGVIRNACRWGQEKCNRFWIGEQNEIFNCCHFKSGNADDLREYGLKQKLNHSDKYVLYQKNSDSDMVLSKYITILSRFYSYYEITDYDDHIVGIKVDENMNFRVIGKE